MPPARSTRRSWSRKKARFRRFVGCWRCSRQMGFRRASIPIAAAIISVDKSKLTQVGRALDRLGIEHIAAYSPEARGRSERMFGTLQDRLVKELEHAGLR